jgi:hypothetical protein
MDVLKVCGPRPSFQGRHGKCNPYLACNHHRDRAGDVVDMFKRTMFQDAKMSCQIQTGRGGMPLDDVNDFVLILPSWNTNPKPLRFYPSLHAHPSVIPTEIPVVVFARCLGEAPSPIMIISFLLN